MASLRRQVLDAELGVVAFESQKKESLALESTPQQDSKRVQLSLLKNILSPVRRLPVEIISIIFELVCGSRHFLPSRDAMLSAFIISSVCIAWRNAAYATPGIWTRLHLSRDRNPKAFMGDVAWVKAWLARSRGLPLQLYLDLQGVDGQYEVPEHKLTQFMEHVASFSRQICWFAFGGDSRSFIPLFRLPSSSFPRLEGIYTGVQSVRALESLFPNKIQTFLDSPKLEFIQILDSVDGSLLETLALPEEQLATLVIQGPHGQSLLSSRALYLTILNRCESLVNLTIQLPTFRAAGQDFEFIGFDENTSLFLPSLKLLKITCHPVTGSGVNFLRCLVAPSLEILALKWRGQDFLDLSLDVFRFQSRSSTRLLALDLIGFATTSIEHSLQLTECLTVVLSSFVTVKIFKFCYMFYSVDLLLLMMTQHENLPVLLPNVTYFELAELAFPGLSQEGIQRSSTPFLSSVILSRYPSSDSEVDDTSLAKLESVVLHGPQFKEDVEKIRQAAPGLRLRYHPICQLDPGRL